MRDLKVLNESHTLVATITAKINVELAVLVIMNYYFPSSLCRDVRKQRWRSCAR